MTAERGDWSRAFRDTRVDRASDSLRAATTINRVLGRLLPAPPRIPIGDDAVVRVGRTDRRQLAHDQWCSKGRRPHFHLSNVCYFGVTLAAFLAQIERH